MKILDSKLFDIINSILSAIQSKTDFIKQNSFLLSNIDIFILLTLIAVYIFSMFAPTETLGIIAFLVPVFVVIKVLITKGETIELERSNFYLLIYLFICLISNFTSSMLPESLYGFMKTIIYFAFYFALCQFLKTNKKYILILLFVIASLVSIESFIGIVQNTIGVENISTWQDTSYVNPEDILSRVYGTLKPYNPNLFGGFLVAGIPAILALTGIYACKKKYKISAVCIICFLLSIFTLFLTGCRGAYLGLLIILAGIFAASFQIVFSMNNKKIKNIWIACCVLLLIGALAFLLINHGIMQRLMSIFILRGDSSTSFRMNVYTSAVQMFHDNWIYGIGVGNKVFREIYGLYMLSGFDALSCYCIFLEMTVESGIFSLIAYLLFILSLIKTGIKKFIEVKDFSYKILLFTSAISIIAVLFHGIFDTIYFRPQIQFIFWTMAAILTVLVRKEKTV